MPNLQISGRDGERSVEFHDRAVTVGAHAACDIVVTGNDVAAEHCSIQPVMGAWKIVDLESDAGTRVNGAYVNQRPLRSGDVVDLGDVRIVFEDAAPRPVVARPVAGRPVGPPPLPSATSRPAARGAAQSSRSSRSGRAAPAGRRGGGRERDTEHRDDRPARRPRPRRQSDTGMKAMLMVGVLVVLGAAGFLVLSPSTTPNERVFMKMRAAERRQDWPAVLRESQAGDLGDPDYGKRMATLRKLAETQIAAEAGREMLAESQKAWNGVRLWRQDDNWKNNEEFVQRLDEFLFRYERYGGACVDEARKERAKQTGSSSPGEAHDAPTAWSRLQADVAALKSNGQFGTAIAKAGEFRTKWGAADPVRAQESRRLETELLDAAGKWFAKQISLAHHKADMGSKLQGRKLIENAARVIGLPEFEERAADELRRLMDK